MSILKRAMSGPTKGVIMADGSDFNRNWGGISGGFFGHYSSETYASSYPYIRAISSEYMTVLPYAIDKNGKTVDDNPIINALYHPNREDSVVSFAEKIAVSTLTRNKTYLLVWRKDGKTARPGGNFRKDTIVGFTFLERPAIERKNGRTFYKVGTDTYDDNEVLVLPGGVDPSNLYAGYSPNEAARRWVKLDDYIADYQAGFFENGAVPAGMFTVTAASDTDYNDAVDALERKHRGAGKNNNVTYSHKLITDTGSTVATSVEWTPLQQANKDIDFKNLFEQTNRRIVTTYGVPGVVMGVDGEAKYDNAEVAEATFAKRAVRPLLLRNYTQLTHELNRITGGFSASITFDYDIPTIADSEKVKAETKKIEGEIIAQYSADPYNYSLDSIVNAFQLSNSYKLLKKGTEPAVIVNDKPEVDEGNEVSDSPNPDIIGGNYYLRSAKSVSARQFEDELEDLIPEDTGYIMIDTEKIGVLSIVDDASDDLVDEDDTDFGNLPGENTPHITILDGVLNQPSEIKDLSAKLYGATPIETLTIEEVGMFDLENSNAIIAKIKMTDELKELRENFDLVPHASKFSTYTPHITLAYITKEADSEKWIKALNEEYAGKTVNITGLNLGEDRTESKSFAKGGIVKGAPIQLDNGYVIPKSLIDKFFSGGSKGSNPKANSGAKQISADDLVPFQEELDTAILSIMERQIERTINQTKAIGDTTPEDDKDLTEEIMAIMLLLLLLSGQSEYLNGLSILDNNSVPTTGSSQYILIDDVIADYRAYLLEVSQSFNSDTQASIQKVLAQAQTNNWDAQTLRAELENILVTDLYRVNRLSLTESNRVMQIASVAAIIQLMAETSTKFNKVWRTTSLVPCPFCVALDGNVVETKETFVQLDGVIEAEDGSLMINDYVSMQHPPLHPNCKCVLVWELVK